MADEQAATVPILTVGKLKERLAELKDDDALVVIDAGKTFVLPVLMPITEITGRKVETADKDEHKYRLGGGRIPLVVIRAG